VLAIVHRHSTVASLIKSAPPTKGIELIEIESGPLDLPQLASEVSRRLGALGQLGRAARVQFDPAALAESRADRLARRLAGLLDRVCTGAVAA
jgi:hypothetical protein